MTRLLTLDLARRTGWAADSDTVGRPVWGTVDLGGRKDEPEIAGADLARWMGHAIDLHRPEKIGFERPLDPRNMGNNNRGGTDPHTRRIVRMLRDEIKDLTPNVEGLLDELTADPGRPAFFTSYESIRMTHGLAMVAGVVCVKKGIPPFEVHVQSWRGRFIGGYPRRQPDGSKSDPKALTIARCYSLGWRLKDDNAADATGIWAYSKSELVPGFLYDNGTSPFMDRKAS